MAINTTVIHFNSVESTNLYAKEHSEEFDPHSLTVISSDKQTRGRGRSGRSWDSPNKVNCYLTFCQFVPRSFPHLQNFGQVLSLSLVDLLDSLEIKSHIKWPNDVLIEGKKVAGILCDITTSKESHFVANGIGLNVNMTKDQLDLIPANATSLLLAAGREFDTAEIRKMLTKNYQKYLHTFLTKGFAPFIEQYRASIPYQLNQKISFHSQGDVTQGLFHSLSDDGSLNLTLPNNEIKTFHNIETI